MDAVDNVIGGYLGRPWLGESGSVVLLMIDSWQVFEYAGDCVQYLEGQVTGSLIAVLDYASFMSLGASLLGFNRYLLDVQ